MKMAIYSPLQHVVYDPKNWDHYWEGWSDGLMTKKRYSKAFSYKDQRRAAAHSLGTRFIYRIKADV